MKVTNETVLKWINENLGGIIRKAIIGTLYSEELLAGIVMREVGTSKLAKFIHNQLKEKAEKDFSITPQKWTFDYICKNMKGDWGLRKGELYPRYHGFGFWQIDIGSYPEFIESGKWQDPYECCLQAIKCLQEKEEQLYSYYSYLFYKRVIIAAYNCGASRVIKALRENRDIDYYTYNRDYSKSVLEFAEQYRQLFMKREKIDNIPIKPIDKSEITEIINDNQRQM